VLYQYYPKITLAIRDGSFFENSALKQAFAHARENNSAVNFAGLLTKANVHASLDHIKALIEMANREGIARIKLHLWSDGKDSPPQSLESFLKELPQDKIATLIGRYYAMDRNQNWQLTKAAYDTMCGKSGTLTDNPLSIIKDTYQRGLTEEYLPPLRIKPENAVEDNDALIFFNYRNDSVRQITEAFTASAAFNKFPVTPWKNLFIATLTPYDEHSLLPVAFQPDAVAKPLGKVLSDLGKNQLRVAETYKYAHVTYFFNGHQEQPFKNEYRVLIPSISTARPEDHPEMRAAAITDRIIEAAQNHSFDFILANYANPDTMAHTANYEAALKAVRVMDAEISRVIKALPPDTVLAITSDHGNVEQMIDPATGKAQSQHDPSPVPFYLVGDAFKGKKFANWQSIATETMGTLSDVAPTILELMAIPQPEEMTGRSLLEGIV
jgi:2,3-bisphosphoglycerate-independent phosphoglycerate mutase